jgi:hypothetical protein
MKKCIAQLCMVCFLLISFSNLKAQAPSQFRFQAVGRDENGKLLSNTPLAVRFAIRTGAENGPVAYREQHNVITDEYGHFNASVGTGIVLTGDFNQIPWSSASHFLQIEYNDGSGYKDLGASALLSVPYAIYSNQSGFASSASVNIITNPAFSGRGTSSEPLDLARQNATLGQVLKWNGSTWSPAEDNNTDNQQLILNGTMLTISGGNTVALPPPIVYTAGQGIQISGNSITNTGDLSPTNELQTISKSGNQIILSQGGGFVIDEVNDADADPNNELQLLNRVGNTITLSQNGGSVDLSDLGSKWGLNGQDISRVVGNVGIGTNTPETKLHLAGAIFIDALQGNYRIGQPGTGNQWWIATNGAGTDLQWLARPANGTPFARMILKSDGKLGLGEVNPNANVVIGQNLDTIQRSFPNMTIGNSLGGALGLGNSENSVFFGSGFQVPYSQITLNGSLGANRGDLSIRGRGVHIGSTHDQSPYKLRVSHETFGFALENASTDKAWEFYVNEVLNGIDLFYEGAYKGTFDAVTGAYFSVSDESKKSNVINLEAVNERISAIQLKRFFYQADMENTSPQIGVSAQNLLENFPELVRQQQLRDGSSFLTVNYAGLGVLALKAIQEQDQRITELERQLEEQQTIMRSILDRLKILEEK